MKSIRGALSTVSQNSQLYIDMVRSGNYTGVYEGTRKECEDWAEQNTDPTLIEY
jgi:hypothetical protein